MRGGNYKTNFVNPFVSKIYKSVKSGKSKIIVGKMTGLNGLCDWVDIYIDPVKGNVVSSLVHEYLHLFYPDWTEERVLDEEETVVALLSDIQTKRLLKLIGDAC